MHPPKTFSHPTKRIYLLGNHFLDVLESASFRVAKDLLLFASSEFLISELDFYCHRQEKPLITFFTYCSSESTIFTILIVLFSYVSVILISVSE